MHKLWSAALAAVVFAASPAYADTAVFQQCDGYGAPNGNGDGMTRRAGGLLGMFRQAAGTGDTSRTTPVFAPGGVEACTAALADPRLRPEYWMRRANLLTARAAHHIATDDLTGTLADLDAAEAATQGHADALYRRSQAIGMTLIRAEVALHQHDTALATRLADQVTAARPYAVETAVAAARIRRAATGDFDRYRADMRRIALYHPSVLIDLLSSDFDLRQWDEILALRARIRLAPLTQIGGFRSDEAGIRPMQEANLQLLLDAYAALAQTMTGHDAEALALLDAADRRIAEYNRPLPNQADGSPPRRRDVTQRELLLSATAGGTRAVADIRSIVAVMPDARRGDLTAMLTDTRSGRLPRSAEGMTVLEFAAAHAPHPDASLTGIIDEARRRREEAMKKQGTALSDIFDAMPEPETANRIPHYVDAHDIIGAYSGNGFIVHQNGGPDRFLINFAGSSSSSPVVQELVLLRAADLARAAGRPGFVVLTDRHFGRIVREVGLYGGNTSYDGNAAEAEIVLVDPQHPPADVPDAVARMVPAAALHDQLAPVYLATTQTAAAASAH